VSTKTLFAPASIRTLVYTLYDVVLATATDIEVQVRCCCCMACGTVVLQLLPGRLWSQWQTTAAASAVEPLHNSITARLHYRQQLIATAVSSRQQLLQHGGAAVAAVQEAHNQAINKKRISNSIVELASASSMIVVRFRCVPAATFSSPCCLTFCFCCLIAAA
jgi:hypothetical protein